jgi:hypothetical protein
MGFYHIEPLLYHFDRKREIKQLMENKNIPEIIVLRERAMKAILFFWKNQANIPEKPDIITDLLLT